MKFSLGSPQTPQVELGGDLHMWLCHMISVLRFQLIFKNMKPKVEFFISMGKLYFISPHWDKRQTARFDRMVQSLKSVATSLAILEGTGAGFISCGEALLRLYQKHE